LRPFSIFNSQFSILLILLLALALRLLLWSQPLHQPANDEVEYVAVARDLLAGRGWQFYDRYHWLRAPLYPLFLAGSLWLAGGDPSPGLPSITLGMARALHLAALPNIALSVATVYLSYRLARALLGQNGNDTAPLVAALLTALLWTLATFASLYMSETLFTFLLTGGLLCLVSYRSQGARGRRGIWLAAGAGILFGLATLTRSITLLFLPVAALWLLLDQPTTKDEGQTSSGKDVSVARGYWSLVVRRWSVAICFLLGAVLVIAPWAIRNYQAYGRVILVETGLSYNLWAFNEPRESQEAIFATLESIPNPAERADYATARGLARLREDPAILARKIWPGWIYLWRVKPIEDRFVQESYYSDVGFPLFTAALVFDDLLYLLIALAGVAGLALYRAQDCERRSEGRCGFRRLLATLQQPKWLLIGWMAYAVTTMLLTHAETRYRHFLFPVLIPYAAWALVQFTGDGRQETGDRRRETGDGRQETGDRRRETGDGRQETGDRRRETGDGSAGLASRISGLASRVSRHPVTPSPRPLVVALLWILITGVWVGYYPREWADTHFRRGWHALGADLAWAAGWRDAALRADERALAARETPDGWIRLGNHVRDMGDTSGALKAYRRAVALTPPYVAAVARQGDMMRAAGDEEAARKAFVGDYVDQQRLVDWSWRGLRPGPRAYLDVGDGVDFGYIGGVYMAEEQQGVLARWSDGRALLRLPGAGPGVLRLRLAAPRPDGMPVRARVCVAGRCQALSVGPTWRSYELPLGVELTNELPIEIESDTFDAPEGRRLGLLIDWADVR
jgi:4-amino-4-deoxy-L-arabinose transferase-like glycosyltransferase